MKSKSLLVLIVVALLAPIFQSCNKAPEANASDLLATVPADVSLVAVINSGSILQKMGCTVSEQSVTAGEQLQSVITNIKNKEDKAIFESLLSGDAGVDPRVLVVFREGYYTYLTGVANDPAKFKKFFETNLSLSWATENSIDFAGNVALAENQFWVNFDNRNIDINEIRHFNTLSESQSFLSNPYAVNLSSIVSDVAGWGNLMGLLNTSINDFATRAMVQTSLQFIFEDPQAFGFIANFDNGEAVTRINALNGKGKNAKYLLPDDVVDLPTIASIGGMSDMLVAINIPGKLIEQLKKDTGSKAPSLFGVFLQSLGSVDGTFAAAISGENMSAVITTDGKDPNSITSFVNSIDPEVNTVIDGKIIKVTKGKVTGKLNVEQSSELFKNALAGIVTYGIDGHNKGAAPIFSEKFDATFSLMLLPEGNSVRIETKIKTSDKKENILLQMLQPSFNKNS